jgi:hypothetical protein
MSDQMMERGMVVGVAYLLLMVFSVVAVASVFIR